MHLNKSIFIINLFTLVICAEAEPTISNISGALQNNKVFAITGNSFSLKPTAAPLKWDNFNAAQAGQQLVAYDPYWQQGNNAPILISSANPRIGNNIISVLKASDPNDQSSMVWRDNMGFADTGKIYMSVWLRIDFGTALTAGYFQVKTLQFTVGSDIWGNGSMIAPIIAQEHFAFPGPPAYTQVLHTNPRSSIDIKGSLTIGSNLVTSVDYKGRTITTGMKITGTGIQSNTTVFAFDSNTITLTSTATANTTSGNLTVSTTSDPTIYLPNNTFDRYTPSWQNLIYQIDMGEPGVANGSKWFWASAPNFSAPYAKTGADNRAILDAVASKLNAMKLGWYRGNYVAGAIAAGTSVVQYDDLYLDNSWARVEIGDTDTYETNTHREIQPATSWTDTTINFRVNQGSFPNGAAYLYVTDINGAHNTTGYPISFVTPSAPAAPTGLRIK